MCDYSLQNVKSRPAKVGDKLSTHNFGTGTIGFASSQDDSVAVCVLPGTELSFAGEVATLPAGLLRWRDRVINHKTAIFRQINKKRKPPITMRSNFRTARSCCSRFSVRVSRLRFFSCRPSQRLPLNLPPNSGRPTLVDRSQQERPAGIGAHRVPHRANFGAACGASDRVCRFTMCRRRSQVF
jgi:hypothetical protein